MSRRRGESRFLASRSGCSVKKNRRDSNDEGSVDRHLARASELVHESQEDEGEGTSLTDRGANARRNASFQDNEPSPAPSPASDAGEGQEWASASSPTDLSHTHRGPIQHQPPTVACWSARRGPEGGASPRRRDRSPTEHPRQHHGGGQSVRNWRSRAASADLRSVCSGFRVSFCNSNGSASRL